MSRMAQMIRAACSIAFRPLGVREECAVDPAAIGVNPFMRDDGAHACGFAHYAAARVHAARHQFLNHGRRAHAANFLVIRIGQVNRVCKLGFQNLGNQLQSDTDKTLHVAGATSVQLPIADFRLERVARPVLAVYGDHVCMAGKHNAAGRLAACAGDGGKQIRLLARGIVSQHALNIQAG
jgi:hypothetical protein